MIKQSRLFRLFCGTFTAFILLIVIAPLVSLAFRQDAPALSRTENSLSTYPSQPPAALPEVTPLNDTVSDPVAGNFPLYDSLTVAERKAKNLETKLPALNPYFAEKVVYLTFDDGPDPENTTSALRILAAQQVKATFFVVGSQVEKYPDTLRSIYTAGHAIGNHSYNHVYRDLYQSPQTYISQLYQTDDLIRNVLGVRPRISRAPGGSAGSFTNAYWSLLKDDGYIEVGWNISSGDASAAKAEQLVANIRYQLKQKFLWNHAIVLMHDGPGHSETIKALPEIIKLFREKGFEFRVVNAETPPAW